MRKLFSLIFWDISLWLSVTAIILLATSELISPHYGQTSLIIEKRRLRQVALLLGILFMFIVLIQIYLILWAPVQGDIYNTGSLDQITVEKIAEIITEEMNLPSAKFFFRGGVKGGRGWKGDVTNMHLSIEKITKTGWKPKYNSEQSVRLAVRSILTSH